MNEGKLNYKEIIDEVDAYIMSMRRTKTGTLKDVDLVNTFEPIRIDRFYIPGTNNPDSFIYYNIEMDKAMLDKYAAEYKGYPPITFRDQDKIKKNINRFKYVKMDNIIGTIIEVHDDHFIVEPKGIRSRCILSKLVELGCKARYEILGQTRDVTLKSPDGKRLDVKQEVYGRSKIIAVDLLP